MNLILCVLAFPIQDTTTPTIVIILRQTSFGGAMPAFHTSSTVVLTGIFFKKMFVTSKLFFEIIKRTIFEVDLLIFIVLDPHIFDKLSTKSIRSIFLCLCFSYQSICHLIDHC